MVAPFLLLDFVVKLVPILLDGVLGVIIERELDRALVDGLLLGVMEQGDVGMPERVVCRDSLVRIELEELLEQVERFGRSLREHCREWHGFRRGNALKRVSN